MQNLIDELLYVNKKLNDFGTIDYYKHYELNVISTIFKITNNRQTLSLRQDDFKSTYNLTFEEPFQNKYLQLTIDQLKLTDQLFPIGLIEGSRDREEVPLDDELLMLTIAEMKRFLVNIDPKQLFRQKLILNVKVSLEAILTTGLEFRENVAQFSNYNNGGAFISVKQDTNDDILERLQRQPVIIDWIEDKYVKEYGFDTLEEILAFILESDYFRELRFKLKEMFNNLPEMFIEKDRRVIKFKTFKV